MGSRTRILSARCTYAVCYSRARARRDERARPEPLGVMMAPAALATFVLLLTAGTRAEAVTLRSGGVAVELDPSGAYSVVVDGEHWLSGGGAAIPLRADDGAAPTLLRQIAPMSSVERGSDGWGTYERVEMQWGTRGPASEGASSKLVTSVRAYSSSEREMIVFS